MSLLAIFLSTSTSFAKSSVVRIGDWNIMKVEKDGHKQCTAYAKPFRTKGSTFDRQKPYAVVEYRGVKSYSFGVSPGYNIDATKGVILKIDNKSRLLDIKLAGNAWTFSANQDVNLMNDMMKNQKFMEIRSYDGNDNTTVDYYSLKGLVNVVNYFDARCS